jgi:hypothetical protein
LPGSSRSHRLMTLWHDKSGDGLGLPIQRVKIQEVMDAVQQFETPTVSWIRSRGRNNVVHKLFSTRRRANPDRGTSRFADRLFRLWKSRPISWQSSLKCGRRARREEWIGAPDPAVSEFVTSMISTWSVLECHFPSARFSAHSVRSQSQVKHVI